MDEFNKLGPILTRGQNHEVIETKINFLQNVCAESDGVRKRDMADEGTRVAETGEGGENDDKMDV